MKPQDPAADWSKLTMILAGDACAILGLAVWAGWRAQADALVRVVPGCAPMQPNTAVGFITCGIALLAVSLGRLRAAAVAGGAASLLGALTLAEHVFATSFGMDGLLFPHSAVLPLFQPGRMAAATAVCFTLGGFALLLMSGTAPLPHRPIVLGAMGSTLTAAGGLAAASYVLALSATYDLWSFSRMAVHTGAGFMIVGAGVLAFAWRDHQVTGPGPPRWLPVPVGLTVLAASVLLAQALISQQREQTEKAVTAAASGLANTIQARLEARTQVLVQMAKRWGDSGPPRRDQWESDAGLFLIYFPGYQAIEWIDPSLRVRWREPRDGNEAEQDLDLGFEQRRRAALEKARDTRVVIITQSLDLAQGGKGLRVGVPIFHGEEFQGFIGGLFRIRDLLDAILGQGIVPGYAVSLLEDGQEIYKTNSRLPAGSQEWARDAAIRLHGVTWVVRVRPGAALLAQTLSPLPRVILAGGVLLALLLAWAAHLALTARLQAGETKAANRQLQREVGERRQVQESLAKQSAILISVLNHMGDGVVVADEGGQFVLANPAAERIMGFEFREVPPENWSEHYGLYRPDGITTYPPEELPLARSIGGANVDGQEIFVRNAARPGGAWISVTSRPLPGPSATLRAGVAVFRDITQQKQAEQQVRRLNAELERRVTERTAQLQDVIDQLEGFSYSVSHDLRAPLRAINGFSNALLEDYTSQLEEGAQSYLRSIAGAAQRMGQLIDDLLAFSRMGRKAIQVTRVDMTELARVVFDELQPAAAERSLECCIRPLPPAWGDRAMLRQVLANLLANAIKFTKARRAARIEVGGCNGGAMNTYYVQDNGAGFDMRYADKLFGVFQRLHTLEEFEGTGVGLAIVRRIVERHGGRVWAEGKIDDGATFHFALPVGDTDVASQ